MVSGTYACWCISRAKGYATIGVFHLYNIAVVFVMSEPSRGLVPSADQNKFGPNYFGLYTHEVAQLLSEDEDFQPLSVQSSKLSGEVRDTDLSKHSNNGLTSAGTSFTNGIGAGLSDLEKERLKRLLRQSVSTLTREVDEMLDPVVATRRLRFHLKNKKRPLSDSGAASDGEAGKIPCKKVKVSPSSSNPMHASPVSCGSLKHVGPEMSPNTVDVTLSKNENSNAVKNTCAYCHTSETPMWRTSPEGVKVCNACGIRLKKENSNAVKNTCAYCHTSEIPIWRTGPEGVKVCNACGIRLKKENSNVVKNTCAYCHTSETPMWRTGPEGVKVCNACGIRLKKETAPLTKNEERESRLGSHIGTEKRNEELSDDLKFLMENDRSKVEETMKKYSDELYQTLGHMEQQLEELLDTVTAKCRPMTLTEKEQLQNMIRNLPPENLDRVVEIIRHRKPSDNNDEIFVDLEEEDNSTLWRLYYYVEAVVNARKLSM